MPSCNSPRPGHFEGVVILRWSNTERDIALGLAQETVADHAALHLVAFLAGQRAIVDAEGHGQRRRVDRLGGQRVRHLQIADRVGHGSLGQPGDGDDIARNAFLHGQALKPAEAQELGDAALLDWLAVAANRLYRHTRLHNAVRDAARENAAQERIGLDGGRQHAEWAAFRFRRRDMFEHEVEQRRHVFV